MRNARLQNADIKAKLAMTQSVPLCSVSNSNAVHRKGDTCRKQRRGLPHCMIWKATRVQASGKQELERLKAAHTHEYHARALHETCVDSLAQASGCRIRKRCQ